MAKITKAERELSKAVDAAFQRQLAAKGAQVDILKINPMVNAAKAAIATGTSLDEAVAAAIETYRVKA